MNKRFIGLILAVLMILAVLPMLIGAEESTDPPKKLEISITSSTVSGTKGSPVSVDVNLDSNPGGIVSATIPVAWNKDQLILKSVTNYHDTIKNSDGTAATGWCGAPIPEEGNKTGKYYLAWNNDTMCNMVDGKPTEDSYTGTGRLCTLNFELAADMATAEKLPVEVIQPGDDEKLFTVMSWYMDDFMEKLTAGNITLNDGEVTVTDRIPGDVNCDGYVTEDDAIHLLFYTYFPEDYPVTVSVDFNKDGYVTEDDAIHLLFYTYFPEDYPIN